MITNQPSYDQHRFLYRQLTLTTNYGPEHNTRRTKTRHADHRLGNTGIVAPQFRFLNPNPRSLNTSSGVKIKFMTGTRSHLLLIAVFMAKLVRNSYRSHACYMPRQSKPSLIWSPNIQCRVQTIKPITTKFSLFSCNYD